jgi:hypothetical protein
VQYEDISDVDLIKSVVESDTQDSEPEAAEPVVQPLKLTEQPLLLQRIAAFWAERGGDHAGRIIQMVQSISDAIEEAAEALPRRQATLADFGIGARR